MGWATGGRPPQSAGAKATGSLPAQGRPVLRSRGGLAPTDGPDATVFPFSQSPRMAQNVLEGPEVTMRFVPESPPPRSARLERPGPQTRRPVGPPQVAYLLQRVDHTAVAVAGEALDDSNPAVRAACQQFGAHIQVPNPSSPPSQVLDAFGCSDSSRSHISPRVFLLPDVSGYPKPLSWERGMTI